MKDMESQMDELMEIAEFIKHFNIHYSLLVKRYKRFLEVNKVPTADLDTITYMDMIVVQIRALCIENQKLKNNYTAQILLRKIGEEGLADRIDAMLDTEFLEGSTGFTISKAIKTLADGFICHYDNFDSDGLALASIIEKQLRNPYAKINLEFIMKCLLECIGLGFQTK